MLLAFGLDLLRVRCDLDISLYCCIGDIRSIGSDRAMFNIGRPQAVIRIRCTLILASKASGSIVASTRATLNAAWWIVKHICWASGNGKSFLGWLFALTCACHLQARRGITDEDVQSAPFRPCYGRLHSSKLTGDRTRGGLPYVCPPRTVLAGQTTDGARLTDPYSPAPST